jgi:hypothetical protein|tara:strand:+ start:40 stop:519 length:480 start_codon:yes stop_codon:yes gene_type:complete
MQQLIEDSLTYDPDTGLFKWLDTEGCFNHRKSLVWFRGYTLFKGYLGIKINGKQYLAHRIAWYLMKGEMPTNLIDHIDRNKVNNKLTNLRSVTNRENILNSFRSDNAKNVSKTPGGRWQSHVSYNGKREYFGTFDTEDEAIEKSKHAKLNNRYRDEQQA